MTLNDGSTHTFNVKNGARGEKGEKGDAGTSGIKDVSASANAGYITITNADNTTKEVSVGTSLSVNADSTSTNIPVVGVNPNDTSDLKYNTGVYINCSKGVLMGAAWNDYAEYRETVHDFEAGLVVYEKGNDELDLAYKRLMPGCSITSDTFGFAIGQTDRAKTPVAVCGRVLAYPAESLDTYKPGDAVCSAPNGRVSKMTREEIKEYPDCIIGFVSSIPNYEIWEPNNTIINGRIWIKVK